MEQRLQSDISERPSSCYLFWSFRKNRHEISQLYLDQSLQEEALGGAKTDKDETNLKDSPVDLGPLSDTKARITAVVGASMNTGKTTAAC